MSAQALPAWRAWYGTAAWKALREAQLCREPNCRMCAAAGVTTKAAHVDHITRHRGRHALFFDPRNLQSLCATCHNSTKQSAERLGYRAEIGPDGFPTDPRHPFNRTS